MMKKFLSALALVVLFGSSCAMSAPIDAIWNLKFGMPREVAGSIMVDKNSAVRVTEYAFEPNSSEALYLVNFFGREGTLLLRYVKQGLRLVRFSFDRKDSKAMSTPPAPAPEPDHEPVPEGPRIVDARSAAPAELPPTSPVVPVPPKMEGKALPPSTNFLHLKSMLIKKYGTPLNEVRYDDDVFGYEWKPAKGQHILLYEDRFTPGSQAVLTYEDANIR